METKFGSSATGYARLEPDSSSGDVAIKSRNGIFSRIRASLSRPRHQVPPGTETLRTLTKAEIGILENIKRGTSNSRAERASASGNTLTDSPDILSKISSSSSHDEVYAEIAPSSSYDNQWPDMGSSERALVPAAYNSGEPINPKDYIIELSERNIKELEAIFTKTPLSPEEQTVFDFIHELPLSAKHSTDAYPSIRKDGVLLSTKEVNDIKGNRALSGFSSDRNKNQFGNEGFVFFRVDVGHHETEQTRYGASTLSFEFDSLAEKGWVSLHDQAVPFDRETTRAIHFNSAAVREIPGAAIDKGKMQRWAQQYGEGTEKPRVKVDFRDEIFYGTASIRKGIALKVVLELRRIAGESGEFKQPSGTIFQSGAAYKQSVIDEIKRVSTAESRANAPHSENEINLGRNILKTFFRPELKVPVGVDLNAPTTQPKVIYKPGGDGRYNTFGHIRESGYQMAELSKKVDSAFSTLSTAVEKYTSGNEKQIKLGEVRAIEKHIDSLTSSVDLLVSDIKTDINKLIEDKNKSPENSDILNIAIKENKQAAAAAAEKISNKISELSLLLSKIEGKLNEHFEKECEDTQGSKFEDIKNKLQHQSEEMMRKDLKPKAVRSVLNSLIENAPSQKEKTKLMNLKKKNAESTLKPKDLDEKIERKVQKKIDSYINKAKTNETYEQKAQELLISAVRDQIKNSSIAHSIIKNLATVHQAIEKLETANAALERLG